MPRETTPAATAAKRLVRRLYKLTEGRPNQWRMLSVLDADDETPGVRAAKAAGWMNVEMHSAQLTDTGRRVARDETAG